MINKQDIPRKVFLTLSILLFAVTLCLIPFMTTTKTASASEVTTTTEDRYYFNSLVNNVVYNPTFKVSADTPTTDLFTNKFGITAIGEQVTNPYFSTILNNELSWPGNLNIKGSGDKQIYMRIDTQPIRNKNNIYINLLGYYEASKSFNQLSLSLVQLNKKDGTEGKVLPLKIFDTLSGSGKFEYNARIPSSSVLQFILDTDIALGYDVALKINGFRLDSLTACVCSICAIDNFYSVPMHDIYVFPLLNYDLQKYLFFSISGKELSYDAGYKDGYSVGKNDGVKVGFDDGYKKGNDKGIADSLLTNSSAYNKWYTLGKADGLALGNESNFTNLFSAILFTPVKVVFGEYDTNTGSYNGGIFSLKIPLGDQTLDISAFVKGLVTISIIMFVIRYITAQKNG